VRRADNRTTFMCQWSWNLGVSTSWNPQGLSSPLMGLLYLCLYPMEYMKHILLLWLLAGVSVELYVKEFSPKNCGFEGEFLMPDLRELRLSLQNLRHYICRTRILTHTQFCLHMRSDNWHCLHNPLMLEFCFKF
jgi:hypothetical protein